jgi:hypothetical protein
MTSLYMTKGYFADLTFQTRLSIGRKLTSSNPKQYIGVEFLSIDSDISKLNNSLSAGRAVVSKEPNSKRTKVEVESPLTDCIEQLKALIPEAFTEGCKDVALLQDTLVIS